jgi:hypothetical protein
VNTLDKNSRSLVTSNMNTWPCINSLRETWPWLLRPVYGAPNGPHLFPNYLTPRSFRVFLSPFHFSSCYCNMAEPSVSQLWTIVACFNAGRSQETDVLTSRGKKGLFLIDGTLACVTELQRWEARLGRQHQTLVTGAE